MKTSVIIPTFGRETLKKLLKRLLLQMQKPFEVLIIDTSKNQKARLSVEKFSQRLPLKYFSVKGASPSSARNQGIRKSRGKLLVFLDDDCLPSRTWLKEFLASIREDNLVVQGSIRPLYCKPNLWSKILAYFEEKYYDSSIFQSVKKSKSHFAKYLISCNFAIKKEALLKYRLFFDEKNFPYFGCDTDLGIRIRKKGIKISYNSRAKVIHCFEKMDFLRLSMRRFKRGIESGRILAKYKKETKNIKKLKTFFRDFDRKEKEDRKQPSQALLFWYFVKFLNSVHSLGKLYGRVEYCFFSF